jgi:hypothetical protein
MLLHRGLELNKGIAAVCYERTRLQRELHQYRNAKRDARHDKWEADLKGIEQRRKELIAEQKAIMKKSRECGVSVDGSCI